MVTINDKISLIIDVNALFNLDDPDVNDIVNGDNYKINYVYYRLLQFYKNSGDLEFTHDVTGKTKTLNTWMNEYRCDINNPKDVIIFLRYAIAVLY